VIEVREERLTIEALQDVLTVKAVEMTPVVIEVGIEGPQGPVGKTYVHDQQAASAKWVIRHELNMHPSVTIVDSAGSYVIGDVRYLDANTLEVTFSAPFAGKAYLN